jgi:hypothetical protein
MRLHTIIIQAKHYEIFAVEVWTFVSRNSTFRQTWTFSTILYKFSSKHMVILSIVFIKFYILYFTIIGKLTLIKMCEEEKFIYNLTVVKWKHEFLEKTLILQVPHWKWRLQQFFVVAGTCLLSRCLATIGGYTMSKSKSKLLYAWRFTANQFVLASSPLRPTTRNVSPNWTLAILVLT